MGTVHVQAFLYSCDLNRVLTVWQYVPQRTMNVLDDSEDPDQARQMCRDM